MFIKSLDLENFRTYENLHFDFNNGTHIFYGDNGQGKTNLLEAIYICSTSRSHRKSKDHEMIQFEKDEGHVRLIFEKENQEYREDLHLKKTGTKGIAINLVPVKKMKDFIGLLKVVLFSPEDLQIVKDGPQERRRFIDGELVKFDKIYLDAYLNFKKVLEERNELLRNIAFNESLKDTLDVWDEQLVLYGTKVIEIRKKFIEELSSFVKKTHFELTDQKEELNISYEPDVKPEEFREKLLKEREKDIRYKTTSVGPQRDDIRFDIHEKDGNSFDCRVYGSQGQKRTTALSLKISELEFLKNKTHELPILLLDDVMSELDENRQKKLLKKTEGIQTFITCTGLEDFKEKALDRASVYKVQRGKITKEN